MSAATASIWTCRSAFGQSCSSLMIVRIYARAARSTLDGVAAAMSQSSTVRRASGVATARGVSF